VVMSVQKCSILGLNKNGSVDMSPYFTIGEGNRLVTKDRVPTDSIILPLGKPQEKGTFKLPYTTFYSGRPEKPVEPDKTAVNEAVNLLGMICRKKKKNKKQNTH
jgi:hypothetical protein